jgi:hypothetical protein
MRHCRECYSQQPGLLPLDLLFWVTSGGTAILVVPPVPCDIKLLKILVLLLGLDRGVRQPQLHRA